MNLTFLDTFGHFWKLMDTYLNIIIDNLVKSNMKITIQNITNFKIEFNQRTR